VNASFPRPVADFLETIPHRPPFVWIDEVLAVTVEGGTCAVVLKPDSLFMGPEGLRRSSYLEFMAQAFGYLRAAQAAAGLTPGKAIPKKAFLVSIQDAVYDEGENLHPTPGSRLTIEVSGIREVGPITLFAATVRDAAGSVLVQARLKVFSE
jgi:predicted hotdog family 3-hydroxylacyl-ACP dehydratase